MVKEHKEDMLNREKELRKEFEEKLTEERDKLREDTAKNEQFREQLLAREKEIDHMKKKADHKGQLDAEVQGLRERYEKLLKEKDDQIKNILKFQSEKEENEKREKLKQELAEEENAKLQK